MNKLFLITIVLMLLFSGLQNVSASSTLQQDIEYIAYEMSHVWHSPIAPCAYDPNIRVECNYANGNLRITTVFYDNAESSIVVQWKGERVAIIDRGVLYYVRNDVIVKKANGPWVGKVHSIAAQDRN